MTDNSADPHWSAIVIMAKAPRPGTVKTRLCPPLSPGEAAALYQCFLLDKIAQVNALTGASPMVAYTPPDSRPWFETFTPPHFGLIPQCGDELGARLIFTFDQLFAQGYAQVLVIDSDTPTLPSAYLEQALRLIAARDNDVVLGPTEDGGYYLIGLRQTHGEIFTRMPWSTSNVFPETRRRAAQLGLTVACTAPWYDIDTPTDLARLRAWFDPNGNGDAQHTRRFLQRLPR